MNVPVPVILPVSSVISITIGQRRSLQSIESPGGNYPANGIQIIACMVKGKKKKKKKMREGKNKLNYKCVSLISVYHVCIRMQHVRTSRDLTK